MDECSEAVRMNYSCGINANFASPNFDFDANNGTWAAAFKHLKTFQIGQYMNHHWKLIETSLISCYCNRETIWPQVKQNIKAVFEQRASHWSLSDPSANGQIVHLQAVFQAPWDAALGLVGPMGLVGLGGFHHGTGRWVGAVKRSRQLDVGPRFEEVPTNRHLEVAGSDASMWGRRQSRP